MAEAALKKTYATLEDLLAIPEGERFHELLAGEIVQKAMPSLAHGDAQLRLGAFVQPIRRGGGGSGGGWVFASEAEIELDPYNVVRPDVSGWRRERMATRPRVFPCPIIPDWICEILSPSNSRVDLWEKLGLYHAAGVQHYWILDPDKRTLRVHRWTQTGYLGVLEAKSPRVVQAEPFDAVDLHLADLFDDEEPDAAPPATG